MGETVISALTGAVSGISDIINGDMDSNPTIRPVLDMTNVNNGLNSTFNRNRTLNVDDVRSKTASISNMSATRTQTGIADPTASKGFKDMVVKTSQEVVKGVMATIQAQPPSESTQPIQIKLHMDGKVISQQLFRINQDRLHSLGVNT